MIDGNTGQVGDKSGRRHPTRRQVESATSNSATSAVNSATTSVISATTFGRRNGEWPKQPRYRYVRRPTVVK